VRTKTGKAMPVDAEPTVKGNLRLELDGETVSVIPPEERLEGELLFLSHFATCPDSEEWRR